jgi:hypothetical protein
LAIIESQYFERLKIKLIIYKYEKIQRKQNQSTVNMLRAFRSLKNQTNTRDNEKEKLNVKIYTVGEGKD